MGGHIIRMEDECIPKKRVLNGKFHNKRPVGKPRTKWEDVFWRDTSQILGLRGWSCLMRKAKAQKGL